VALSQQTLRLGQLTLAAVNFTLPLVISLRRSQAWSPC